MDGGPAAAILSCGLTLAAGFSVAAWGYAKRPSELALASGTVAVALAYSVVHLLGWLDLLTRGNVHLTTLIACGVPLAVTLGTRRGRMQARDARRSLARFAVGGVVAPLRQRSLTVLGALAVLGLSAWTAYLAYLAPSSAWDGVMYHEPMVGFALQNQGFAPVDLGAANAMLTPVDGYPRLMENLMVFLVVAWDRRLIDLVPSLIYPLTLIATYVLMRRFVPNRLAALGFAGAYCLIPGIALQLRSTYVDLGFATFVPAALAFVCKRELRGWDLVMAGVAIGLVGASKVTGFIVAPLIGAIGLGMALSYVLRTRRFEVLLALGLGMAIVVLLAAPTYWRNWTTYENPLWPGAVRVEALDIDWRGPLDITNMNIDPDRQVEYFFGPPRAGEQHHDTKDNGYGNVPPYVIPPLALLGLLFALWRGAFGPERGRAWLLLAVTVPLIATFAMTPARHWARLNLHTVLACFLLAAWLAGRLRSRLFAEGVTVAMILGGLITLCWSEPAWDVDLDRMRRLRSLSATERAAQRDTVFTLMPTETARAREAELGPGDLVVFEHVPWAGLLFNERFDNRVGFIDHDRIPRAADWVAEAERRDATWIVSRGRGAITRELSQSPRWERVGPADATDDPAIAFRRRPVPEPAPEPAPTRGAVPPRRR